MSTEHGHFLGRKKLYAVSLLATRGLTHLCPPELIPLMGNSPMSVPHHGNEEVEHEQGGDDGKGGIGDAVHEGQIHVIVGRAVDDGEEELKSAEQCHGVVKEMAQLIRVLCLEDDIEGCSTQGVRVTMATVS